MEVLDSLQTTLALKNHANDSHNDNEPTQDDNTEDYQSIIKIETRKNSFLQLPAEFSFVYENFSSKIPNGNDKVSKGF